MIRVVLPFHLRNLAGIKAEAVLDVARPTVAAVLDALEIKYPMLKGTIRDSATRQRRPLLRFFACEEDISHQPLHAPLPAPVASGQEPLLIVGSVAGG